MTLRAKLVLSFSAVALITLSVGVLGFWQTRKLATALHEVGVVRLTSIQALDTIFEAKTSLDASKRELLRSSTLFVGSRAVLDEELRRQQQSWKRAEKGRAIYAAQPKTREETAAWQALEPAWQEWQASYEKTMDLLARGRATGDRALLEAAHRENQENLFDPARRARELLTELVAINARIAVETREQAIAGKRDSRRVQWIMLAAAVASVASAVVCGLFLGRIVGRRAERMAAAFSRIATGDLRTQVAVESRDEFGEMAAAMNHMVDSLRSSELRFRAVFENSIDAIGVSQEGRVILANAALLKLFGYAELSEVAGRDVLDFIAPSDHAIVEERRAARLRGDALSPLFELTGRRRDGTTFSMELRAALFEHGSTPYTVAIHRDVTARNLAAARLQETAERLQLALHTSKLGVWRRHRTTQLAEWDARVFEIFGRPLSWRPPSRDELLLLVLPEDRAAAAECLVRPAEPGKVLQHRFRVTRPDGVIRHLEIHWTIHGDARQPAEWEVGVLGDVTEIVESTRLRERLGQAQKMEALGTLSAGIAHDFNNLLTSINGFVELAVTTLPPGHEAASLLNLVRQGTTNARDLVRRILNFSRPSAGARGEVDLVALVRDTAPLISAGLPRQVQLKLELAPSPALVLADPGQLQQVLLNLCTNAAHAIGANSGIVTLEIQPVELASTPGAALPAGCRPGPHARLSVHDTGCGMDAATRRRVFEPFFTTKPTDEGTGLGLAIVREIITTHEGGIDVSSTPGLGTTFTIHLPLHHAAPAPAPTPAALPPTESMPAGKGERVLVIDDETSVARLISIALQRAGYNAAVHHSPVAAWEQFAMDPAQFRLLIIDQKMPELNGDEFITRARGLAPWLPVIRMSGRFETTRAAANADGTMTLELKKPFSLAELLGQVGNVLNADPRAGGAVRQSEA